MGVDQSVLLLKKGNDIEQETVFSELRSYGEVDKWNYEWYENYDYNQRYGDFDSSDAFIITNAKKPYGELTAYLQFIEYYVLIHS